MKFNVLCDNLIIEQDEVNQQSAQPAVPVDTTPQPENFDDVEPMPQVDVTDKSPLSTILARLLEIANELNGPQNQDSIQNKLFSLESPNSIYTGISKLTGEVNRAAGSLLDLSNNLATLIASAKTRARDLARIK